MSTMNINHMSPAIRSAYAPVFREYEEKLGKMILPQYQKAGAVKLPRSETGRLYVFFYSVPYATERTTVSGVYGKSFLSSLNGYLPSGRGDVLIDSAGIVVGEVFPDSLYVLFDLPEHGTQTVQALRSILDDYIVYLTQPELYRQRIEHHSGIQFGSLMRSGLVQQVKKADAEIVESDGRIAELQSSIVETVREREEARRVKEAVGKMLEEFDTAEAVAKLEAVRAVPGVRSVIVTRDWIKISIEREVVIRHGGERYFIGREFELIIYPNKEKEHVQVHNLTQIRGGYCHPHIMEDGKCCLGDSIGTVAQLVAEREYDKLVMMMISFLETYTSDRPYHQVENWPIVYGERS